MPTRSVGTFKKSGDSVASPDFRLSGRNSPSDPAKVDVGLASVRTLLIQLADFSLDFQLVKDECFVENESGTYSVDRDKVLALFQEVMTIRAQQDGWKLAPTKAEVTQLGNSPPANFSRRVSTDEYRFAWPAGHARLASAPGPPSPQAQTPQVQVPRNGSTPQAARSSTPPPDGANGSVPASDAETRFAELLSSAASIVERERQEMVIKAVHPRYTLPEQANKPISRKLLPEEMRADARQFDQSMFFSDKGNTARPPAPRGASSKRQPRARKRPRSQMQVEPDNPALPVPSASKQGPPTPGTKNKSNGGKVGDRAGSLKKN